MYVSLPLNFEFGSWCIVDIVHNKGMVLIFLVYIQKQWHGLIYSADCEEHTSFLVYIQDNKLWNF